MECGNYLDMSKSLKPRIWLQYKLVIPACLKAKDILLLLCTNNWFQSFCFWKPVSHKYDVNLPLNLCDAHLQKSKYSEITCWYLLCKRSFLHQTARHFPVNSVARIWIWAIFSCLSNSQIPYLKNSMLPVDFPQGVGDIPVDFPGGGGITTV